MTDRAVRWDWVVVVVAFLLLGFVASFGLIWRGVAFAGAYTVGRWDAEVGAKYRDRAGNDGR